MRPQRPSFELSPRRAFEFRLALDLGMTHAELGKRMSAAELTEWLAFYGWKHRKEKEQIEQAKREAKAGRR